MTIAPIAELGGITGIMPQGNAKQPSPKTDFKDAFSNATDSIAPVQAGSQMIRTEGTGAKGTESDTAEDQKNGGLPGAQEVKRDTPAKAADTKTKDRPETGEADTKDAVTDTGTVSREVDPEQEQALQKTADKLVKEAAKVLGISEDELSELLSELGLTASSLLDPRNINLLVANAMGDGDMMSLVTDGALSDAVKQLNELVTQAEAQIGEILPAAEEGDIRELFSEALDAVDVARENAQSGASAAADTVMRGEASKDTSAVSGETLQNGTDMPDAEGAAMKVTSVEENDASGDAQTGAEDALSRKNERRDAEDVIRGHENLAEQTVTENPVTDGAEEVRGAESPQSYVTDPQELLEQVQGQLKTKVTQDVTSIDMTLHPASLGNVALRIASQNGNVTAQFTAQNESVKEVLEGQIMILKQNLEQQGVKVEAVEVTVASHAFEQSLEQGNDGESEASEQERERLRRATHRINLGDSTGEGAEGLEEADEVTVEMMQADGQRLNYRV